MQDYRNLKVWELADELLIEIYDASARFPSHEKFTLTSQIRRSALSVGSNLAEGCGRATAADFRRFVDYACGSSKELEYQLSVAFRLGYMRDELHARLEQRLHRIQRMLRGLRRSLS